MSGDTFDFSGYAAWLAVPIVRFRVSASSLSLGVAMSYQEEVIISRNISPTEQVVAVAPVGAGVGPRENLSPNSAEQNRAK